MTKILFLSIILLLSLNTLGQSKGKAPLNQCLGAVNIFDNNDYSLQFTGTKSMELESTYPSLKGKLSENKLWCSYVAAEDGDLSFDASVNEGFLKMVIFKQEKKDICAEIKSGIAEIKRIQTGATFKEIGLNKNVGDGVMYSLPLNEGDKISIVFCTDDKTTKKMSLDWSFVPLAASMAETKVVDLRGDEFGTSLNILIQDGETNTPMIGYLTIEGNKNISGLYNGSSFYFTPGKRSTLLLKCEVEGYFFNDTEVDISGTENEVIIVKLERIAQGKSIKFEEIEFEPGTSLITESSDPKLRRLKDFLALNAELTVEIQGHVHAKGENNNTNQKLSEARAKRVMKYLTNNGIDKDRLTTVGYGNTKPIYPNAKFSYEEQANRRVEVMIK